MEPAQARLLSPESHQDRLRHPHTPQGPRTRSHPPCTGEHRGLQAAPGSSTARGPHPSRTAPAGETINRDRGPQAMRHGPGDASAVPSARQRTPLLLLAAARGTVGPGASPSTNHAQSPVGSSPSAHCAPGPRYSPRCGAAWAGGPSWAAAGRRGRCCRGGCGASDGGRRAAPRLCPPSSGGSRPPACTRARRGGRGRAAPAPASRQRAWCRRDRSAPGPTPPPPL